MTIYKSQGSQFEVVVVVLPAETSRLLTRELLYTAVTRGKKRVHIVGSEAVIRHAITRSVQRASGLGARFLGELAESWRHVRSSLDLNGELADTVVGR